MRASRWEIVGAWLRLWTPPRDVEIPPFPWRIALVAGAVLVLASVGAYSLIAPAIDDAKRRDAAREARAQAAALRAERARLTVDQRPRAGHAARVGRLHGAGHAAQARAALLAAVLESVARDARARVAAGTFERPVRELRCRHLDASGPRVRIACFAITTRTAEAAVGQPVRASATRRLRLTVRPTTPSGQASSRRYGSPARAERRRAARRRAPPREFQ